MMEEIRSCGKFHEVFPFHLTRGNFYYFYNESANSSEIILKSSIENSYMNKIKLLYVIGLVTMD